MKKAEQCAWAKHTIKVSRVLVLENRGKSLDNVLYISYGNIQGVQSIVLRISREAGVSKKKTSYVNIPW